LNIVVLEDQKEDENFPYLSWTFSHFED